MSDVEVECSVLVGGPVGDHKGINVPDLKVPLPALTEKDTEDALFALSADVDYFALSFVQRAQDVIDLRLLLQQQLQDGRVLPKIIAKIEKPQVNHTTAAAAADGLTGHRPPAHPCCDVPPLVVPCACDRPSRPSMRSSQWWTG